MASVLQRTVLKSSQNTISFDCVEVEDAEHDADLTEYPVEADANRTDHIIILPEVVRLTVHVTNAPIQANAGVSHMEGAQPETSLQFMEMRQSIPSAVPLPIRGADRYTASSTAALVRAWGLQEAVAKRVQNVYGVMLKARDEVELFTVVTEHRHFDNMVIKSIHMNRTSKNVRAPKFEITLRQFFTSTLSTRDVSSRFPAKERSKPKQDAGKKQPPAADAKTSGKTKSVAKHIFGG